MKILFLCILAFFVLLVFLCIRCLYDVGWPAWCDSTASCHWTGIYIKNECGYMEPYNNMAYWSVYGMRNPNIAGTGTPVPGYEA